MRGNEAKLSKLSVADLTLHDAQSAESSTRQMYLQRENEFAQFKAVVVVWMSKHCEVQFKRSIGRVTDVGDVISAQSSCHLAGMLLRARILIHRKKTVGW